MSFVVLAAANTGWLIVMIAGMIEIMASKKMSKVTVWLVVGSNLITGVLNIANLWHVWFGTLQLSPFLLAHINREKLLK